MNVAQTKSMATTAVSRGPVDSLRPGEETWDPVMYTNNTMTRSSVNEGLPREGGVRRSLHEGKV